MKLIVFSSRFPWPLDKGDKVRIFYQVKYLSKYHDVYLISLSESPVDDEAKSELLKYCKEVHVFPLQKYQIIIGIIRAFFTNRPLQVGYFYSKKIAKEVDKLVFKIQADYIYGQLVRVSEYIKDYNVKKCLDYQDALSAGLKRRFDKSNLLFRMVLKFEYKRMLIYETKMSSFYNVLTIITEADRKLLPTMLYDNVVVIPNGVDFDFFNSKVLDFANRKYDVVFTGNMNYPPNIKAVSFLIKDIMPIVWKKKPNSKVLIAGASPSQEVKSLNSDLVVVTGWVDDIRTAYDMAKVFVAPMQIGTGLQNKLLEAMAMGVPCVTSDLANNALKAKNEKEILISPKNSAELFADNILLLLNNNDVANSISTYGQKFVKQNYDWNNSVIKLNRLFEV